MAMTPARGADIAGEDTSRRRISAASVFASQAEWDALCLLSMALREGGCTVVPITRLAIDLRSGKVERKNAGLPYLRALELAVWWPDGAHLEVTLDRASQRFVWDGGSHDIADPTGATAAILAA